MILFNYEIFNSKNDPLESINCVVVNCDGDLACCEKCKNEYEKQRDNFFDNIGNDNFYNDWIKS
jgi:hypothetical protein